jgi:hypothetical protein
MVQHTGRHIERFCATGSITAERATKYAGEQKKENSHCSKIKNKIREENLK